jgi:hypothetical protein
MKVADLRRLATALPEVTEEPHFHFGSFRVRGKIFATVPPDGEFAHLFVPEPVREECLATHAHCAEALTWGQKVVGLRIDLGRVPPTLLRHLVRQAWAHKAPKRLAAGEGLP